jgi:hypothetical protein
MKTDFGTCSPFFLLKRIVKINACKHVAISPVFLGNNVTSRWLVYGV